MAEWKKVIVSGSSAELNNILASGAITGSNISSSGNLFASLSISGNINYKTVVVDPTTGRFYQTGSYGGGGIFINQGTFYNTQNTLQITGSTLQSSPSASGTGTSSVSTGTNNNIYALLTSESIYSFNHNTGYPTANSWKENLQGSYFNNFDANTNVSEILRFIAGLLSQSAPDASPNTKTFGGLNPRFINPAGLTINGRIPSQSTNSDVLYLQSKGFANSGSQSFAGFGTVYSASTFAIDYSSSAAGNGSGVSSSNDSQLFGLGSKGFTVNISASTIFKFYSSSNETVTTNNSSSQTLITLESENDLDQGASRRTIPTTNPAVIPSAYQDGRFTGSFSSSYNPVTFTATSSGSTGWYHFTQSITIYTGSQTVAQGVSFTTASRIFRSAYLDTTFLANTITHTHSTSSLTAASRSLSGAPYLSQSTYLYICTSSGIFNPLYSTASNLYTITTGSTFLSRSAGNIDLVIKDNGTINTSDLVYSSSISSTAKAINAYPSQNDVIKVSASFTLNHPAGTSGSAQTGFISANTGSSISASAFGRGNGATGSGILLNYFIPGTFGQPIASGTMALYNRFQGYDGGALTGTTENFTGETYRLKITDTALSGAYDKGTKFTTSSYEVYNLTALDLQVKPGFLVKPGGTYGYWLTDPNSSQEYKYYIRAFKRDVASSANSMTINVGRTLVNWEAATNDSIAVALLFSSSGVPNQPTPRIYDVSALTSNLMTTSMATDNFKNPFNSNIALYGNIGGSLTGTTYTVIVREADSMILNNIYRDFVMIVRYKGNPVPVSSSIITFA
jgi:hypothetical protein